MSKYALCCKVEGKLAYLNRIKVVSNDTSTLSTDKYTYDLGALNSYTLLADAENWKQFLTEDRYVEIMGYLPEIDFRDPFRMAFVKVSQEIIYATQVCVPFTVQANLDDFTNKHNNVKAEIQWDSFC